jgi:hypothetical protein
MNRVAQFKTLCTELTDAEIAKICGEYPASLGKLIEHFVPFGWEVCNACGKYAQSLYEDVDAYDDRREDVCQDCVDYCGVCQEAYAPSGHYKHEDCLYNMTSKSKRREARARRAVWMNESEPSESEDDK